MMRRFGSRAEAWWRAVTGSASAAAAVLGLLICLCTLLAVIGPRAAEEFRTRAFRQVVATSPATDEAVIGTVSDSSLGIGQAVGLDAGLIRRTKDELRRNLRMLPLSRAAADWSSLTTPFLAVTGYGPRANSFLPPQVELSYRDALARNVRVIAGRLPGGTPGSGSTVTLQAAVTEATAQRFGVTLGSRLPLPGTSIVLAVTAIVQPRDPAAPFWTIDPIVATPELENPLTRPYWAGGVFVAAGAVAALQTQINTDQAQVTWMFPLAMGRLTAAQATQLQSTLANALATAGHVAVSSSQGGVPIPVPISFSSGVGQLIAGFEGEAASVGSVLDLFSVSLAVLAAVVVLLAGWLLTEQRRQEFAVLRARGASRRQLGLAVVAGTAVTAVPGAAVGAALAVALTAGNSVVLSWWLAGLVVLAALAGPVLITVRTHRGYAAPPRADQPLGRVSSVRRLIIEAALVAGSAGGLIVLRYQGSGADGDVYASAAPVLLAIAVAVVLLRVYPLLVRATLRLRGQRASAATFLGLARAARTSASAALPAFALVLALALVSFAGMVRGAVVTGQVNTSWQQVGADAVISEPKGVSPALDRAVEKVPGVEHVVRAGLTFGETPSYIQFDVLAVDPTQYAALVAATPLPRPPAAFTAAGGVANGTAPVPALLSPSLEAEHPGSRFAVGIGYQYFEVRAVGQTASLAAVDTVTSNFLVLPSRSLGPAAPPLTMLLVVGPALDHDALAAAVARYGPGGTVVYRSRVLAGLQDAPLQHGADLALVFGGVAAGVCGLLVLLLSLLLSEPSRQLSLTRMSTMGLSAGQSRLLVLVEALPQLLAVLVGGAATAVALVPLLGPALSLSVFTGGAASAAARAAPGSLAIAAGAVLVLAIATLALQTMVTSHTAARSIRVEG